MDNGYNNLNNNPDFNGNNNSSKPEGTESGFSAAPSPNAYNGVGAPSPDGVSQPSQPYGAPSYNGAPTPNAQGFNPRQNENQAQTYGYSYGPGYVNAENPYGPSAVPPSKPKKKKNKGKGGKVSVGVLCIILACSVLVSAGVGFGASYLMYRLNSKTAKGDGTTVLYESTAPLVQEVGKDGALSVSQVAAGVGDSVVEITTETVTTSLFYGQYVITGAGSGVIVSEDGYIVTNNHVIDGATNVTVVTKSGQKYNAKLIGRDRKTDLAVVKVNASGLKPAVLGDSSKVVVGQNTVVIGNPLGSLGGSVTAGIVSALDRQITVDKQTMTLMQIDAAINPGNSGGGAFDLNGNLIGIVNAKSTGQDIDNLGFAIPVNTVKNVISDLIKYGYVTGRLSTGFTPIDLTNPQAAINYQVDRTGIYVYSIQDADSAFRRGDLLVSMDGTVISTMGDFNSVLDRHKVGDKAEATIIRNGEQKNVSFTFREYIPSKDDVPAPEQSSSQQLPDIFDFFF